MAALQPPPSSAPRCPPAQCTCLAAQDLFVPMKPERLEQTEGGNWEGWGARDQPTGQNSGTTRVPGGKVNTRGQSRGSSSHSQPGNHQPAAACNVLHSDQHGDPRQGQANLFFFYMNPQWHNPLTLSSRRKCRTGPA